MASKAEQAEATRRALLKAARRLFTRRGYGATSVDAVVVAAKVTKGALYHHFVDKAALFQAVFEEIEDETVQRLIERAGEGTDPLSALHNGAEAFLDICLDPAVRRIALIEGPTVLGWERWRELELAHGMGIGRLVLQAAMDAGQIPPQPLEPIVHLLFGALIEGALLVANSKDPAASKREVSGLISAMIDGLTGTHSDPSGLDD
jgi:AcrR family transcriptional regulator